MVDFQGGLVNLSACGRPTLNSDSELGAKPNDFLRNGGYWLLTARSSTVGQAKKNAASVIVRVRAFTLLKQTQHPTLASI